MLVAIGVLLALVGAVLVWFYIPYSPIKSEFRNDVDTLIAGNRLRTSGEVFTEEDLDTLPMPIQKYLQGCGYIGTPKMSWLRMAYHDVTFMQGRNGPELTIDYTQYNFAREPGRLALIDSGMFGIPFEGYDYYQNGKGGMKGVIAKVITLFDQTGADMDKACLVTFLAESLFMPTVLLQDYITLEELSEYEVRATITYGGQTASGIFTFNERYEMVSFTTKDRVAVGTDGSREYVPWSALCGDYRLSTNGIRYPSRFQAVWNYPDGDFIYFDGEISGVSTG